ncbi:hypothetical protein GCM10029976_032980 [Kribbella albertanoniae]|uniref:Secreted protein n=1 Tax=Kribbella albertanoniae TaxID=1266829 RepID=A0A4R4QIJ8_9ACTN|nr:hypothetical protein [Kribbella albertanoniae]TDC35487.1 hypothetical protein E1261_01080 [Kribbella albertanoniae]
MKRLGRVRTVAVAVGAAVAAVSQAAPVRELKHCADVCWIAHEVTHPAYRYEAEVDNQYPINGSWIRVGGKGAHADYYQQGDDQLRQIYSPTDSSNSQELTSKVIRFRVCGPNALGGDACGSWWLPK